MTPPLIKLLYAAKAENQQLIHEAMSDILETIKKHQSECEIGKSKIDDVDLFSPKGSLDEVVKRVLDAYPELAQMPETEGGGLPLHVASSLGDIKVVNAILSKYPKAASIPNRKGKLPIHYAARQGRTEICCLLLDTDPKISYCTTSKLKLPLHYAVSEGYEDITYYLLESNPDGIHSVTSKGKVPLHFAARWGHVALIEHLLDLCQDLAQCLDWERQLPLHDAAREGQLEAAKILIKAYPDGLKTKNIFNELPIFAAVRFGSKDLVAEMIHWYPASGKAVLTEALLNDHVNDWDWDILELCLRGAVGILEPYEESVNSHLMTVRNHPDMKKGAPCEDGIYTTSSCGCLQVTNYKSKRTISCKTKSARNSIVTPVAPSTTSEKSLRDDNISMKSPKKHKSQSMDDSVNETSLSYDNIHHCLGYCSLILDATQNQKNRPKIAFLALHAAIESSSSLAIFHRILASYGNQLQMRDSYGMLPLHIAAYRAKEPRGVAVFHRVLNLNPTCAFVRDSMDRLPLHLALLNKAETSVIKSLLETNKASGFTECGTNDKFRNSIPLFIATTNDCSLDVVYMLFRGNPASISMFA